MGAIECECVGLGRDDLSALAAGEPVSATALELEVRRFRTGSRARPVVYRWQCQRCGRKHGRAYDGDALPIDLHPSEIENARPKVLEAPRPSSLQRRRARKRSSSAFQAQRTRVLERDSWTCQGCGETELELLEVHHVRYPEIPEEDVPDSDLQTACGPCNLAERAERLNGGLGGRLGGNDGRT